MTTASVKQMIKSVSASSIPAKTDGGKFDYFLQPQLLQQKKSKLLINLIILHQVHHGVKVFE